jgi:hypothetical protein
MLHFSKEYGLLLTTRSSKTFPCDYSFFIKFVQCDIALGQRRYRNPASIDNTGVGVRTAILTENDSETVIVGLATLRALVDAVKESLSNYIHD